MTAIVLLCFLLLKFAFRNSDSFLGRVSSYFFSNNHVELVCSGIDSNSLDVVWNTESGQNKIIESGVEIATVGYEYGPNSFLVSLSDNVSFNVGNWKTNRWNSHDYRIEIIKDSSGYQVNFKALGADFERTEIHYNLDGELDGDYRLYYENGKLSCQAMYQDGQPEGKFVYYYENGVVRATNQYLNGKANGAFISYTPDGKIEFQKRYANGEEIRDSI